MKPFKSISKSDSDVTPNKKNYREGKRHLEFIPKRGEKMDTCATIGNEYICCNVKVLKSVSNCPYDCSYCFLQNYLNDGKTSVVDDIDGMMEEVKEKLASQPWRFFRIGTWELGDSLALEDESGQARALIERFAELDNVVLELKTKSANVDNILTADHQGKTVVSWSMNTEDMINKEEHLTASLDQRIKAIEKVAEAGYPLGFHFDPMILHNGWKDGYSQLVSRIFEVAPAQQIAWISIGSLRFNPEMKRKMQMNFPRSKLTLNEMVLGPDGKMRYIKAERLKMYQLLYDELQRHISPFTTLYFCMERWDVWKSIFGYSPDSIGHLDYLFAVLMKKQFPNLKISEPDLNLYKKHQDS